MMTHPAAAPLLLLLLAATAPLVGSHGALYIPRPRNSMDGSLPAFAGGKSPIDPCTCNNGNWHADGSDGCELGLRGGADGKQGDGQACLWWSQGCSIGCDECATATDATDFSGRPPQAAKIGFRRSYCNSTLEPTLPRHAWTLNMDAVEGSDEDSYRFNPWRAPGHAPVIDPCGQAGGKYAHQHIGGDSVFHNTTIAGMGMMGSKLPPTPAANRTRWVAGTFVEVAWGVRYNHGGGYSYRLCRADEPLTEACFQRTPLDFDRTAQTLRWNNGSLQYPMGDKAVFVDGDVTFPRGSVWARNPLPRIWDSKAGLHDAEACPGPTTREQGSPVGCLSFPAPCPWDTYTTKGLLPCSLDDKGSPDKCDGDGMSQCSSDWVVGVVSDRVLIPHDLPAGEYVLSWRWDAEETAQIWANCADVSISAAASAAVVEAA